MTSARAVKKSERAEMEFDPETTERVVSSLVSRGDISALDADERAHFYVQLCESLGLNPASQPFAVLRLNGKEVMYPTRGATDQLAAMHRLNREIIDGPKEIQLAGTKLVYAVCRATHPNGRIETAVATVPLTDPVNVLMKCETKAKRRATLSILGLGMLDETEIETIPQSARSAAPPIVLPERALAANDNAVARSSTVPEPPASMDDDPALAVFAREVEGLELPGEGVMLWLRHRPALARATTAVREAAWKLLVARIEALGGMKNAKLWLKRALAEEDVRRTADTGTHGRG